MPETVIAHEFVANWSMDVEILRHVGEVRGVRVEIWNSKARNVIALVVSPTVPGFTVLATGALEQVEIFANVGKCVLTAMSGVLPIVVGDCFRGGPLLPVWGEAVQRRGAQ